MRICDINKEIFREYDIRGIYGKDLNEDVAYTIGKSYGSYISNKTVVIGHDNRLSSPILYEALKRGLLESGKTVICLSLVTSPMLYFAKYHYNTPNAIMVTASHNPKEYNGFKFSFDYYSNACGKDIEDFRDFTSKKIFKNEKGKCKNKDILKKYINSLKKHIHLKNKKIKVVYDTGNGTASAFITRILDSFNIEYSTINDVSDGSFPVHDPDPSVKNNQEMLSKEVIKKHYDLGIGIDGDADRVGIVDEKGNILSSEYFMILFYRALRCKTNKAIYDVKCSLTLIDELNKLDYEHEMYRTGASYLCRKVNMDKYLFGAEYSGHACFTDDYYGFDDGIYASLRVIEILSKTNLTLSELLDGLNKYYSTEELRIGVEECKKDQTIEKVRQYVNDKKYKYISVDGIRVVFEDGWALIRKSNTSAYLTVRYEAKTAKRLDEIQEEFNSLLKKIIK